MFSMMLLPLCHLRQFHDDTIYAIALMRFVILSVTYLCFILHYAPFTLPLISRFFISLMLMRSRAIRCYAPLRHAMPPC